MAEAAIARSELIVGGQKSGKCRRVQDLAAQPSRHPGGGGLPPHLKNSP
jgi:hypothetical protein